MEGKLNSKYFIGTEAEGAYKGRETLFIADNLSTSELSSLFLRTKGKIEAIYFGAGDYCKAPRNIHYHLYRELAEDVRLIFEINDLSEMNYIPVNIDGIEIVFTIKTKAASRIKRITAFKTVDKSKVVMVYPEGRIFENKLNDPLYLEDKEVLL